MQCPLNGTALIKRLLTHCLLSSHLISLYTARQSFLHWGFFDTQWLQARYSVSIGAMLDRAEVNCVHINRGYCLHRQWSAPASVAGPYSLPEDGSTFLPRWADYREHMPRVFSSPNPMDLVLWLLKQPNAQFHAFLSERLCTLCPHGHGRWSPEACKLFSAVCCEHTVKSLPSSHLPICKDKRFH